MIFQSCDMFSQPTVYGLKYILWSESAENWQSVLGTSPCVCSLLKSPVKYFYTKLANYFMTNRRCCWKWKNPAESKTPADLPEETVRARTFHPQNTPWNSWLFLTSDPWVPDSTLRVCWALTTSFFPNLILCQSLLLRPEKVTFNTNSSSDIQNPLACLKMTSHNANEAPVSSCGSFHLFIETWDYQAVQSDKKKSRWLCYTLRKGWKKCCVCLLL